MKFSYTLIKKLVPEIKSKKELINMLNTHSFESEDAGGDVFEVSISPNRFSDAASHIGIAAEASAILGKIFKGNDLKSKIKKPKSEEAVFEIEIKDRKLCSRYLAQYFEDIKIESSPKWMQKILIDCGLRPINNVVDIMNYAMLETGQPLHAFDYDKLAAGDKWQTKKRVIVRRAKKGEKIITLDNQSIELRENFLIVADSKEALAIAGIKGGKKAEVDKKTKKIIVEAANFDGVNIYKSSKSLKLFTDASSRFSHNLNPELTFLGLNRAGELLQELVCAKAGQLIDLDFNRPVKKIIKFSLERFNKFIGLDLDIKTCEEYLKRLGFKTSGYSSVAGDKSFLAEVPLLRQDIETFEDLTEEISRLYGYNKIKPAPAFIRLSPSGFEDGIVLKDKIRKVLVGMGLSEVYNYSFVDSAQAELENPISGEFRCLRSSLADYLLKNIKNNSRFFDEIKIFEIGRVFENAENSYKQESETSRVNEKLNLGIAVFSKNKETFFELKGIIRELFKKIGLVDFFMKESENGKLEIQSGKEIIGFINYSENKKSVAEVNIDSLLKLIIEEHEYHPLPKYPSIMRDISIMVDETVRVGEIIQTIQEVDFKFIEDVDLMDEYEIKGKRGLTFRIIFQSEDRTLKDDEVNREMEKISKILKKEFKATIR